MSEKELNKYYYLKMEVIDLEERIKEFGTGVKAAQIKGVSVESSHNNKSIQEMKMELINRLTEKRVSALEQYLVIERYIEEVEDAEIRTAMRYRYLSLMKWEDIGNKMYQDRTTIYKKTHKYILSHNSHTK